MRPQFVFDCFFISILLLLSCFSQRNESNQLWLRLCKNCDYHSFLNHPNSEPSFFTVIFLVVWQHQERVFPAEEFLAISKVDPVFSDICCIFRSIPLKLHWFPAPENKRIYKCIYYIRCRMQDWQMPALGSISPMCKIISPYFHTSVLRNLRTDVYFRPPNNHKVFPR